METPLSSVSVAQLRANFAAILRLVEGGETVLVTRRDQVVARLEPITGKEVVDESE